MKLQQVFSYVIKAVDDYGMIEENDNIAVGISGGKDSLTLLYALQGLQRFLFHQKLRPIRQNPSRWMYSRMRLS